MRLRLLIYSFVFLFFELGTCTLYYKTENDECRLGCGQVGALAFCLWGSKTVRHCGQQLAAAQKK